MLTQDEVRHVAMLARLGLSDEEIEAFRAQLLQVLDYIAVLQQVDTSAIPPTAQILTHGNVARPDRSRPSWPTSDILSNAPDQADLFIVVPAVLEDDRGSEVADGTDPATRAEQEHERGR